ncbi:MAG: M15 family metallopeptidase [Dysgonamonadaceae bacterium]|nr:M15 family metallopeptidase [Dysgonamonadaceae bacterium]
MMRIFLICLFSVFLFDACNQKEDRHKNETFNRDQINDVEKWVEPDTIIIDSKLSFEEAIEGSNAPQAVIDELELMDVNYISTDGKLHMGQILTNKKLAPDLKELFQFMLEQDFVIEKAIPIVAYNWSDSLSMADNNTYSFCYRNATYSKHARGMAIDINPRFNPLRWKNKDLPNEPVGAVLDTTVNGTLHPNHPVVKEFRKRGFRWGHTFSKYWDDHHFERN